MADKTQIMKEAQKYLAKGQVDRAIAEWEKLLRDGPDGNVYNIIGDLHLKRGDKKNAMDALHKAAGFFRSEGFVLKALALYKKVLNLNPADANALYALGELSEDKGLATDAIKYFLASADALSKEGRKDSLLGVYQKILSLSPSNIPLRGKIAEILMKEGLRSDAMKEYVLIAEQYQEKGETPKAVEYLQKVLGLVPNHKEALLGLSTLYEKTGDAKNAAAYLKEALRHFPSDADVTLKYAGTCFRSGDMAAARSALEKVTALDPSNIGARRLLGDILLREGERVKAWEAFLPVIDEMIAAERYDEAVDIIEPFRDAEPIETGRRLVSLYRQMGDNTRTAAALVTLGDALRGQGRRDDALTCYRDALQITPDDDQLKEFIEGYEKEADRPSGAASPELPAAEPFGEMPAAEPFGEMPAAEPFGEMPAAEPFGEISFPEAPAEAPARAPAAKIPAAAPDGEKKIEEFFLEADIFTRYGLISEALKLLEGLKAREPQNMDLHARLKSLYAESGDKESAVTECLILSELHKRRGDEGESEAMLREALAIAPDDPRLEGRGVASFLEPTSFGKEAPPEEVQETVPRIEDYEEDIAEADFYMGQGLLQEATKILHRLNELFPNNRNIGERLASIGQLAEAAGPEEMAGAADVSSMFEHMEEAAPAAEAPEAPMPESFAQSFGMREPAEEDSFVIPEPDSGQSFGMPEPAEEESFVISEEEQTFGIPEPEPPQTFRMPEPEPQKPFRMPEPEPEPPQTFRMPEPEPQQSFPAAPEEVEEFEDLSGITEEDLVDAQEMPEPSLDSDVLEIFQEFKKGLEKELGEEDSETHYNLGIAYKEMGLIDDAIKEFQTARNDPKRFIQSATLLSTCYMEKGLYPLAVDALNGILKTLTERDETYWSVTYDLAEAHEKSGDSATAARLFTEVYGWNAKFRDVAGKLEDLKTQLPREEARQQPPQQPQAQPREQTKAQPKAKKDRVSYL